MLRLLICLAVWWPQLSHAELLGTLATGEAAMPRGHEQLLHTGDMLVRIGARILSSSDLQAGPALALVSSFAQRSTGPESTLDALVFMALWHDEVEQNPALEARMREQAVQQWQSTLASLDSTQAANLGQHSSRVIEYLIVRQSFQDYVLRRFSVQGWPPTPAELERRLGLEDKMRTRVLTIGQRHGVEILDPKALAWRVPGWTWAAAVERFLALGL